MTLLSRAAFACPVFNCEKDRAATQVGGQKRNMVHSFFSPFRNRTVNCGAGGKNAPRGIIFT